MEHFILTSEEEPSVSIRISSQGIVDELDQHQLNSLIAELNAYGYPLEVGENIFDDEWINTIHKLKNNRNRLSMEDEEAIKRIADKL